jgi:hypothetical protein
MACSCQEFRKGIKRLTTLPTGHVGRNVGRSGWTKMRSPHKSVKRVCIPNRSTKSPERKRQQKKRWFRDGQRWRTGCEGISVIKTAKRPRPPPQQGGYRNARWSDSVSLSTTSSISAAPWKGRQQPRRSVRPSSSLAIPPVTPGAAFAFSESTDHNPANVNFAQEVV